MNKFDSEFFKNNRKKLSLACPGSLILITAHSMIQSSGDTTFTFRQDSNFWYLTGLDMPDAVIVIDTSSGESVLLLPARNDYQNEWDGEINEAEITKISGIKKFETSRNLEVLLADAKKQKLKVCYLAPPEEYVQPYGFYANPARRKLAEKIKKIVAEPKDIRIELARLRQVKQPVEIAALQKAINLTGKSLDEIKLKIADFENEKDLSRAITAKFFDHGSDGHGFEPIIAAGKNASIIHYRDNNSDISKKDLVLFDIGATRGYYSADISRTWSVGKPTERQLEVHSAVLEIQDFAFSILKPGVLLREYQKTVEEKVKAVMKKIKCSNADDPFPHGFSHFLGLDVHDAGDYDSPLQENSVITVEPGIYLKDEGIGVRIEDDVLITKTGFINLSSGISRDL